jgi:DNA-binding FadR family transcriptional regulator
MKADFGRVEKSSLSDDLTERLVELIRSGVYGRGDRLRAIMERARRFGGGHPTVREVLLRWDPEENPIS